MKVLAIVYGVSKLNNYQNIKLLSQDECGYINLDPLDFDPLSPVDDRLSSLVTTMHNQYNDYFHSAINTARVFENLLIELKEASAKLKAAMLQRGVNPAQIFHEIDADRSVGILNVLWHTISFTARNNTKPQCLSREDAPPLLTGRIIALNGDFQDAALEFQDQEFPEILSCEIASLYIPADAKEQAIVKVRHMPDKELYYSQEEAAREFLFKILEVVCSGGLYHENDPDLDIEQ
jgi:hypothetical protein